VLVIKRITITLHLTADEEDRETVERVLEVYEDGCQWPSLSEVA
jgi:hypothetical protein